MTSNIIMIGIVLFLMMILVYKMKYNATGNENFFDINNTKAMRGFWCLVVILVHVPSAYQNKIQDMIGSFGFIGVTFFFMTSAYGLALSAKRKNNIKNFWRTRLPKIIIPNWIVNIVVTSIFMIIFGESCNVKSFIGINLWVQWLLLCYLIFWIGYKMSKNKRIRGIIICSLVLLLSLGVYYLKHIEMITRTTWTTEVMGFIWGIVLANYYDEIKTFFSKKWLLKTVISGVMAVILGIAYLKFKNVFFVGDYILKIVLGIAILSFVLILNSRFKIGNAIIWFLGDISFEIYLIHVSVFKLVKSINSNMESGVFIFISMVLTIILAKIIHEIYKLLSTKRNLATE